MSDDPALRQREWIEYGFTWLDQNWPEDRLWRDIRPGFLQYLGVTDADLTSNVDCRALGVIIEYVDRLIDPDEQRRVLLTQDERYNLREQGIADWEGAAGAAPQVAAPAADGWAQQEQPAGAMEQGQPAAWAQPDQPAAPATEQPASTANPDGTQYFEGYGLMRVDPVTNQWVPAQAPPAAEPAAVPDVTAAFAATDAALAQPAAPPGEVAEPPAAAAATVEQEPAPAPQIREEDRKELDAVVQQEIAPLISEALAGVEGSELLSEDEIQKALAEALQRLGSS